MITYRVNSEHVRSEPRFYWVEKNYGTDQYPEWQSVEEDGSYSKAKMARLQKKLERVGA